MSVLATLIRKRSERLATARDGASSEAIASEGDDRKVATIAAVAIATAEKQNAPWRAARTTGELVARIASVAIATSEKRKNAENAELPVDEQPHDDPDILYQRWVERLSGYFEKYLASMESDAGLPRREAEEQAKRATALLARNLGAPWCALRAVVKDPRLPADLSPVDRLPYPLPDWVLAPPDVKPTRRGVFSR